MDRIASTRLLQALRGNPLTVLVGLAIIGGQATAYTVAATAGLDPKTTRAALTKCAAAGLVERTGRYNWRLAQDIGQQLPLFLPSELYVDRERENLPLPQGEGGSSLTHGLINLTTSPPHRERENLPLVSTADQAAADIAALISELTGAAPAMARRAAVTALAAHDPAWVHEEVLRWTAYALAAGRKAITNPGALVAARLSAGQLAPAWVELPPHLQQLSKRNRYIPAGYEDIVNH